MSFASPGSGKPDVTLSGQPIVIIGAPRSGTNMLRDVLSSLPGWHTWPCDEIPYIWRHGNRAFPHDELQPRHAHRQARNFIRRQFNAQTTKEHRFILEKTCANSLRPAFVAEVLPEARFLYIVRNGLDASASAMKRWRSDFDLSYSLAKARFVPWSDIPFYGWRYLANRLRRIQSEDKRLGIWGPAYEGMAEDAGRLSLAALSATQWRRCVENSDQQLATMPAGTVLKVRYEDFVADPQVELLRILEWLDVSIEDQSREAATSRVHRGSVGKATAHLQDEDLEEIRRIVQPRLNEHGYD